MPDGIASCRNNAIEGRFCNEWYTNEVKKVTKEITVKSESMLGAKLEDIGPGFTAKISKASKYNPDK